MNFKSTHISGLAWLAIAGTLTLCGCGGYDGLSTTGYEYSKALYALSNKQKSERIELIEQQIDEDTKSGKLPAREASWLLDICEKCQAQQWKAAQAEARRMMEDQVKY